MFSILVFSPWAFDHWWAMSHLYPGLDGVEFMA